MRTMTLTFPETVFSSIRLSPEEFIREMRIDAASQRVAQQRVSHERAADIAGVTRAEFIDSLAQRGISLMQADYDEIMDEANRA